MTGDYRFPNCSYCYFKQFKIDSLFSDFGQLKIYPTPSYLLFWAGYSYFTVLGKTLGHEKQSKPSPFDKKFKNQAYDLAQVIFNDLIKGNQEVGFSVNK